MQVARLERRTDSRTGAPYLSGATEFDLPQGSIVLLRKLDDGTYALVAVTDGRPQGDRTASSLLSFIPPPGDATDG